MHKTILVGTFLVFSALLALSCGSETKTTDGGNGDAGFDAGFDAGADAGLKECLYTPEALALDKTHKTVDGVAVLPSGRAITPAGTNLDVGSFSGNMVLSPDGKTVYISNNGKGTLTLTAVDATAGTVLQKIPAPKNRLFYGLAFSPDGNTLYAAGGSSGYINVFDVKTPGSAKLLTSYTTTDGFPVGLIMAKDGGRLYATQMGSKLVTAIDPSSGNLLGSGGTGLKPFAMAFSSDGTKLYTANVAGNSSGFTGSVTILQLPGLATIKSIDVGKNPSFILGDPSRKILYVLAADQDTIDVIDETTDTIVKTASLLGAGESAPSVTPLGAALSPDGKTLFVASASRNSVDVLDAAALTFKGSIPVGWYPNAVTVSPDGKKLFVLNAKGDGTGSNADGSDIDEKIGGTLSIVDVPSDAQLVDLTKKAQVNNIRPTTFFPAEQCKGSAFPIPFGIGEASPIRNIIFILKENRTFDQVFGDFNGADVDPDLLMFGEEVTPNHHKLAREFVLMDNYYMESEVSVQGHLWATGMDANDYTERARFSSAQPEGSFVATGVDPVTCPLNSFVFQVLYEKKISFVDYGEIVGMGGQSSEIMTYWDQSYPGVVYTTDVPDKDRADYFIKRLGEGFMPRFTFMLLPRDHTAGTTAGKETPRSMVADNDEALGMIVDAVSKSKYWNKTLIFVTEDDPQDGFDHVDAHRSFGLVISPWTRKGYVSKVHHSFGSFYATMERIFGLPALNTFDGNAAPLFDVFTNVPDSKTYDYIPRKIPVEYNTTLSPMSEESGMLDFTYPDNQPGLQKILWHAIKGMNAPFPGNADGD